MRRKLELPQHQRSVLPGSRAGATNRSKPYATLLCGGRLHSTWRALSIGWTYEGTYGGYRSECQLRLDRARDEFYCTNLRARWDRVGRVIERSPGARVSDPLQSRSRRSPGMATWCFSLGSTRTRRRVPRCGHCGRDGRQRAEVSESLALGTGWGHS